MLYCPQNYFTEKSCMHCIHFRSDYETPEIEIDDYPHCIAFPDGIPDEIYDNGHYEPRPDMGQTNEIVFEPDMKYIEEMREFDKRLAEMEEEDSKKGAT